MSPGLKSMLTRVIALVVISALLPWPGFLSAATSDDDRCERHGRSCQCVEMCRLEEKEQHTKAEAPSCHRETQQRTATPKPETGCRMTRCGAGDPARAQSSDPSTPPLPQHELAVPRASEQALPAGAETEAPAFAAPPHPPPRA